MRTPSTPVSLLVDVSTENVRHTFSAGNPIFIKQPKDTRLAIDFWTFVRIVSSENREVYARLASSGLTYPGITTF